MNHADTMLKLINEICLDSLECPLQSLLDHREHEEKQQVSSLFLQLYDTFNALVAERDEARERRTVVLRRVLAAAEDRVAVLEKALREIAESDQRNDLRAHNLRTIASAALRSSAANEG